MKVTKAVFKRLLKECILELHAEGKLVLPGRGDQQTDLVSNQHQTATLDEVAQGPTLPWSGKGPIQANLLKMALEDTRQREAHRHIEMPGAFSMPMPPPSMGRATPTPSLPTQGPQQFPPTHALLTEDGGVNPMALPGASKWASLAFAKPKPRNLG